MGMNGRGDGGPGGGGGHLARAAVHGVEAPEAEAAALPRADRGAVVARSDEVAVALAEFAGGASARVRLRLDIHPSVAHF